MVILKPALPKDTDEFITLQRRWLLFVFTAALHLPPRFRHLSTPVTRQ
jgi:hypothetical protein